MPKEKLCDIEIDGVRAETEKAYALKIDGAVVWVPKSQVEVDDDAKICTMPEWLAIEKELI